jgi:hypothetical protein
MEVQNWLNLISEKGDARLKTVAAILQGYGNGITLFGDQMLDNSYCLRSEPVKSTGKIPQILGHSLRTFSVPGLNREGLRDFPEARRHLPDRQSMLKYQQLILTRKLSLRG